MRPVQEILCLIPNHFLVFRRAKNALFILGSLVTQKILFIWLLARNVVCNILDLPLLILELGFVTTNLLCSQTKQLVKQQYILTKPDTIQATFRFNVFIRYRPLTTRRRSTRGDRQASNYKRGLLECSVVLIGTPWLK